MALLQLSQPLWSFENDLFIPTDEKEWIPLNLPTPHNPYELLLIPKNSDPRTFQEQIFLKEIPFGDSIPLESVVFRPNKKMSKIICEKQNKNYFLIAYNDLKNKVFTIQLTCKINRQIYLLLYLSL